MTLATLITRSQQDKEGWKYTDLGSLVAMYRGKSRTDSLPLVGRVREGGVPQKPASGLSSATNATKLLFTNGIFQPDQSRFGSVPSCILMGDAATGYCLTLGEQTCLVAQPIELVFVTSKNAPQEIATKLKIDIGANGRLTLLERHASHVPHILETEITLGKHAKFVHGKRVSGANLSRITASLATGAFYTNFTLITGGRPLRNEIDVRLTGEQAQATLNGAMLLRDNDHADTTTRIAHLAPQGTSRQTYKTVLDDKARGVFQGKIHVAPHAQKTDGHQLSRALLLSDQAEMDAKPELEIFADDVKCSHGSAIGDLDDNAMFYLRARGLNGTQARALLIAGFIGEILDEIPVAEWRAIFGEEVEQWLS